MLCLCRTVQGELTCGTDLADCWYGFFLTDGTKVRYYSLSPIETLQLEIPFNKDGFVELCADARTLFEAILTLFEAILANKKEMLVLANLRDTLLPKLMSGEIDVSKIELPAPPNNHLHADC